MIIRNFYLYSCFSKIQNYNIDLADDVIVIINDAVLPLNLILSDLIYI